MHSPDKIAADVLDRHGVPNHPASLRARVGFEQYMVEAIEADRAQRPRLIHVIYPTENYAISRVDTATGPAMRILFLSTVEGTPHAVMQLSEAAADVLAQRVLDVREEMRS